MAGCKDKIHEYLIAGYKRTGEWPFLSINQLVLLFGPEARTACNELYKEGIIKPHEGINCKIIEYIPAEDKNSKPL